MQKLTSLNSKVAYFQIAFNVSKNIVSGLLLRQLLHIQELVFGKHLNLYQVSHPTIHIQVDLLLGFYDLIDVWFQLHLRKN